MRYFIYWKSLLTKYRTYGSPVFDDLDELKKIVQELNDKHSNIITHKYASETEFKNITSHIELYI